MEYQIQLIPLALSFLSKITDKRIQQEIRKRIEKLKIEPDKQGKGNISINAGKEAEVNLENEPALVRKHRLRLH